MSHDINLYFNVAKALVEDAGKFIKEKLHSSKNILTKSSPIDFVTETDRYIEEILINGLKNKFPDHRFIGEESTNESNKAQLFNDPTWIIDPIDGTLNFVHGNPCICISVGLFINKVPEIGIVYSPVFCQMFTAIKGQGAWLNGNPIKVSGQQKLEKSLVIMEGGTSQDPDKRNAVIENFSLLYPLIQGFRSNGSCVYNMCSVALGACDAYFEFGIHIWDIAAAMLLITEAGGVVMDPSGGPLDVMSRRVLCASSNELAQEITKQIKQYYPKRDDE